MYQPLGPGSVFAERFEIVRPAGSGGMGAVYQAHDRLTGESVALKLLHRTRSGEQDRERFAREARLLAEFRHSGIVSYVADGQLPDGSHYLVMEWLAGEDLAARLLRGPLSIREAVLLTDRVAEALAVIHQRGIVHRDLKPSNIFLPGGELARVKLLDFGIARRFAATQAVTQTGMVLGTPEYMAPEQARGVRELLPAADFFSLGCILYECLTGQPPFFADHLAAVLVRILFDEPKPVELLRPEAPTMLSALLAKMLKKDPSHRLSDASALRGELAKFDEVVELALAPTVARSVPFFQAFAAQEQRLFSVVLAVPSDDTLAASAAEQESPSLSESGRRELLDVLATIRGHAEFLANGALVVTVPAMESAKDQAVLAARAALLVKRQWPAACVSLATGRGMMQEQTTVGEVVELAARLQSTGQDAVPTAERTGVLLDALSARLLQGRFVQTPQSFGAMLVSEEREADGERPLLGKPTPCVGREVELTILEGQLQRCQEESEARVVLVTGPPGTGKSRLRHEYLRRTAMLAEPPIVLSGRGDLLAAGAPYGIIGQALKQFMGLHDAASVKGTVELLDASLVPTVARVEHSRVATFLGELCGIPCLLGDSARLLAARKDPRALHDEIRRAFIDWLAGQCATGSLLIILDDLQWGDTLSIGLIDSALQELPSAPLCVAAFARPEVHTVFPRLWSRHKLQEVPINPLGRKACERLIRQVLGVQATAPLVARLIEQSQGNALFLEELIRAVGEGSLTEQPETIVAMLQARVGRFQTGPRRVALAASIFGSTFLPSGVAALLDVAPVGPERYELAASINSLVEAEVLSPQSGSPYANERQYGFRHALIRDAAYSLLTDKDVSSGHLAAARFLEQTGEKEPLVLAEHYRRGGDIEQTFSLYLRAASEASRMSAIPEARQHYSQAYGLLSELPESDERLRHRVDILLKQSRLGMFSSSMKESRAKLDEAQTVLRSLSARGVETAADVQRAAWIEFFAGLKNYYFGRPMEARGSFERLYAAAEAAGDKHFLAILAQSIGSTFAAQGVLGQCIPWLLRAAQLQEYMETDYERFRSDSSTAAVLAMSGRYLDGLSLSGRTVTRALESKQSASLALCYMNRALMLRLCGEQAAVHEAATKALSYAEKSGELLLAHSACCILGWACCLAGRFDEGKRFLLQSKQLVPSHDGQLIFADCFAAAEADIALREGDLNLAITLASELVPRFRTGEHFLGLAISEQVWGLALGYHDLTQSRESDLHLSIALQVMERTEQRMTAAALRMAWAHLCHKRGDTSNAEQLRKQALAQYEASGCMHIVADIEQLAAFR